MAERILKMPRLGETMEEGKIVGWLISPGDSFKRGDPIIEIETDKTIAEFPALGDGKLYEWIGQIDDTVVVGAPLARIDIGEGFDWTADGEDESSQAEPESTPSQANTLETDTANIAPASSTGRVRATPVARKAARENNVDILTVIGTGRRGRIERADVLAAVSGKVQDGAGGNTQVHFAALKSGRFAYTDMGENDAPVVVLLHGFAGDRTTWAGIAAGLRRAGKRVIVPDLPSHGLTEITAHNSDDLGRYLPEFLDVVAGGKAVDVVAHSLGAVAAATLAQATPSRIKSLTLIAPAGIGSEIDAGFVQGMANATTSGEVAHLLRRIAAKPVELSDVALKDIAAQMAGKRLVELANAVTGPFGQRVDSLSTIDRLARNVSVSILFGLQDRIIPWAQVTGVSPLVNIHLLSQSGHMPQWDQTADVLDILLTKISGEQND